MGSYVQLKEGGDYSDLRSPRRIRISKDARRTLLWFVGALLGLTTLAFLPHLYALALAAALVAWLIAIFTLGNVTTGRIGGLVLFWVLIFPLGYYFLSFPSTKPVFTLDRAFIALCLLAALCINRNSARPMLADIKTAGWWWMAFLFSCALSLTQVPLQDLLGPLRILIDGFVLPIVLGAFVILYFDAEKHIVGLHAASCLMAMYIGAIGFIELVTVQDLMSVAGTATFEETDKVTLFRVDGPFESSAAYALIGMITLFFILYLRSYLPERLPSWQRMLHYLGVVGALATGLMTFHRGMVIALSVVFVIDYFSKHHLIPKSRWQFLAGILIAGILILKFVFPELYERRVSNPDNLYQRMAQHQQTLKVIRDHPILGVGIDRFYESVYLNPRYVFFYNGLESMNFVHNNVLSIAAETGLVGLLCYFAAQFTFARAIWRARKFNPLGWHTLLYIFLVYTIFGMDVTSGYFSDVNLWFMLACGVIAELQARSVAEYTKTLSSPVLAKGSC